MWFKAWSLIVRAFNKGITYRAEVLLWFILDTAPILVLLLVWSNIFQHQSVIGNYQLGQIMQYYLLAYIISSINEVHFENYRVQQIREGKIDFYLTRPLSYLSEIFLTHIGGKIFYMLTVTTITIGLYALFNQLFHFPAIHLSLVTVLAVGLVMLAAFITSMLFGILIVLAGFWFEHAEGAEHFKWIIVSLFSGWMIPLDLMPSWLAKVSHFLPFKYLYSVPIGLIQHTYTLTWQDLIYVLSFAGGLWLLATLIWHRAQYQYTSHGG